MNNFKETLFGYDFPQTGTVENISIKNIALESDVSSTVFSTEGATEAVQYLLKGLTADLRKDLQKGRTVLEFWIEAIDHRFATSNGNLYPAAPFKAGMETVSVTRQYGLGGIPGKFALVYSNVCKQVC